MFRSFSEPSVSGSVESPALPSPVTAGEEAEQVEDVSADRSRTGQRIPSAQEEQPSTSSGVQIDRAPQERHEVSQGLSSFVSYSCVGACPMRMLDVTPCKSVLSFRQSI